MSANATKRLVSEKQNAEVETSSVDILFFANVFKRPLQTFMLAQIFIFSTCDINFVDLISIFQTASIVLCSSLIENAA